MGAERRFLAGTYQFSISGTAAARGKFRGRLRPASVALDCSCVHGDRILSSVARCFARRRGVRETCALSLRWAHLRARLSHTRRALSLV